MARRSGAFEAQHSRGASTRRSPEVTRLSRKAYAIRSQPGSTSSALRFQHNRPNLPCRSTRAHCAARTTHSPGLRRATSVCPSASAPHIARKARPHAKSSRRSCASSHSRMPSSYSRLPPPSIQRARSSGKHGNPTTCSLHSRASSKHSRQRAFRRRKRRSWWHKNPIAHCRDANISARRRLNLYADCPRKWYFRYLCGAVEDKPSSASAYGTAFHAALEAFHKVYPSIAGIATRELELRLEGEINTAFETHRIHFSSEVEFRLNRRRAQRTAKKYLTWLHERAQKEPFEVVGCELKADIELDGIEFRGYIDRVDRDVRSGRVTVFDYKTGSIAESAAEYRRAINDDSEFQLSVLLLGADDGRRDRPQPRARSAARSAPGREPDRAGDRAQRSARKERRRDARRHPGDRARTRAYSDGRAGAQARLGNDPALSADRRSVVVPVLRLCTVVPRKADRRTMAFAR